MKRFDEELKKTLVRVDPPAGFVDRVLARVAEEENRPSWRQRLAGVFTAPRLRWVPVAALCLAIMAGVGYQREMARRAEGERAKEQVLLALRITAEQIQDAKAGVSKLNR